MVKVGIATARVIRKSIVCGDWESRSVRRLKVKKKLKIKKSSFQCRVGVTGYYWPRERTITRDLSWQLTSSDWQQGVCSI